MKRILIIEDEEMLLNALEEKLSSSDFTVLRAKDGQEGLKMALQEHPDLILLDIMMPKMDGLALLGKLREDEWGKKVPVIMLTNLSPDSDPTLKAVIDNQPAYYLIKSDVKLEDVVEKANELLSVT